MITQARLKEVLHYSPDTGEFVWLTNPRNQRKVGKLAGSVTADGYATIGIDGFYYKAHRLAHLYMTGILPTDYIDHINGYRNDNRWDNLRNATRQQNQHNSGKAVNNTSGFKGVTKSSRGPSFQIKVKKNNVVARGFAWSIREA
jgi:hypothetical protein